MRGVTGLLAALVVFAGIGQAAAQSLADIEKAEEAVTAAWEKTPLTFQRALFITDRDVGYGMYNAKEGSVFKSGEAILVYAEPVGYGWKDNGDGTYTFGFDIDLLVKTADGNIVGGKEKFQHSVVTSHHRNREFLLLINLTFDGAPPGDYVVVYTAHDIVSGKTADISLPFTIAK